MNYLLIGLLILSQMMILPTSFRWSKEVSAQILIISALCCLIWKKNKSISLFILWSMLLFFITKSYSINDVNEQIIYNINLLSLLNFINIILFGLLYYVLHQINFDKKFIFKTFCFIAVFQSIYVILQKCQIDQFFINISSVYNARIKIGELMRWPVGLWANESVVGWCIALCSPFFLAFKEFRYKAGYFISFIAILCTKASAGIIGFVIGFLFWLFFKNRKLAILLILCILILGSILFYSGKLDYYLSDTHRFLVWKKTLAIWNNRTDGRALTGFGHGSFRVLFWQRAPEFRTDGHWAQAHNEYLQVLFEQGFIGLGIMLSLMWITFYNFIKSKKGLIPITSLIICSIISFVGFPFRLAIAVIPIFALVLAEKEISDG